MVQKKKHSVVEQIAADAGVSRAAAYAALNPGKPSTIGISEAKRKKVLASAKKIGYVRNDLARSLVTGRTHTIGVCVQSIRAHFFTDFFTMFDDLASEAGYTTFLSSSEFSEKRERHVLTALMARRVDAMIVAGHSVMGMKKEFRHYVDSGGVVLFLGHVPLDDQPQMGFDAAKAVRLQAEHVHSLGHRRVAHLNATAAGDMRVQMHRIRQACFAKTWVDLTGDTPGNLASSTPGHVDDALVETAVREGYTALVCATDALAMSLIAALAQRGLSVPEDVSVIGHDDIPSSAMFAPPLTTIRLPREPLAREAWRIVSNLLDSENAPEPPERVLIPPELIVRLSTQARKEA